MKHRWSPAVVFLAFAMACSVRSSAGADVAVAVGTIADDGVNPMFVQGSFDPGKAFGDILTDKLVAIGTLSMVDRAHIDAVMAEQKNAQSGAFAANNAVAMGHMVGANFMIVGRIAHLDKAASSNTALGNTLGSLGISSAAATQDKYRLDIELQLIDSASGRIVKAFTYDQAQVAHGVTVGNAATGAGYTSQQFASSAVGQLLNSAGADLAKRISAVDLTALPAAPSLNAQLIAMDGTTVIVNKGSADGVMVGMFLNTYHAVTAHDPVSGKDLVTNVPDGEIEIISVSPNSSAAKVVSGKPTVPGGFTAKP